MANTLDLGRLFFTSVSLGPAPLIHFGWSQEVQPPYRNSRVAILRLPFGKGLVIGWWQDTGMDEEQALTVALEAYGLDLYHDDIEDPDTRDAIRENIARNSESLEEEWTIVAALGLEK